MDECPNISCSGNELSAGPLQRLLNARVAGEFSDDQFVAAIRGSYTKNEFVDAVSMQLQATPESTPRVMALVNRLNKRGEIPNDLVRLLESKIARGEPCGSDDGVTVDHRGKAPRNPCLAASHPPRLEVGRVLRGRYVIEQRLGNGGKGTVFKALDRYRASLQAPQRYVAIKVLHGTAGTRDESIEALRQELQSAQMLSHPNIVRVYDFDRDGDLDFFTMEYLEGELLNSLMQRFQPLPMSRPHAWSIIRQIASGLEHAHGRNMVHADLRPQNIMITNSGEVRILDFGASRLAGSGRVPAAGRTPSSGTPAYSCCELLDGRNPDPRDDLYSLACISYELLAGAHPFQRRRANEARDFAIVPARPSGLKRRQWHALARGLSWHRAGRSIPVGDWFEALQPKEKPAARVASIGELKPIPVKTRHPLAPLRASAVFSVLISTAAICMLFVRMSPGGKVSSEALPPGAANAPSAYPSRSIREPSTLAPSATNEFSLPAAIGPSAGSMPLPQPDGAVDNAPKSARPLSRNSAVANSLGDYQVQPGQRFAEIRVHRPANAHSDAPLVWWTEAASAKPGIDYVAQAKVAQSFPKGKDSMSVFVKLLPKSTRSRDAVFYVAVTGRGDKRVGQVTHTAVRLPSTRTTF